MNRSPLVLALLLSLAPSAASQAGLASRKLPIPRVVRPGLAGWIPDSAPEPLASATSLYFGAGESGQGVDLNADGDTGDLVLQRADLTDGSTTNLAVEGQPVAVHGGTVLFVTSEAGQRTDLNGDGDQLDSVWQAYSETSGAILNTQLDAWLRTSGGLAALAVSEAASGQDLDGDGLHTGRVLHVWRFTESAPVNLGYPIDGSETFAPFASDRILFLLAESRTGDRNGDGDTLDRVAYVYDAVAGTTTCLGLAAQAIPGALVASDEAVAFLVPEAGQGGLDLNGDGDALDDVAFVHDARLGLEDTGLACARSCDLGCTPFFAVGDRWVVIQVPELGHGHGDLDGDGLVDRLVPHAWRNGSGQTIPLRIPRESTWSVGGPFTVGADFVTYHKWESAGSDWNGDGDTSDSVLFVRRFDQADEWNTGLAMGPLPFADRSRASVGGDQVGCFVHESAQGQGDLNGDGDLGDKVAFLLDTRAREVRNLGVASLPLASGLPAFAIRDGHCVLAVFEADQGRDLDGDGDLDDRVLHVYDSGRRRLINTHAAAEAWPPDAASGRVQPFRVREEPGRDRNGDGDFTDTLVEAIVLDAGLP